MAAEQWHLDKKVPIGLIIGFVIQTVVIVAWGATKFEEFNNRLATLERSDSGQSSHESRIVILEQQFNYIRTDLAEIKALLRRQVPVGPGQPQ